MSEIFTEMFTKDLVKLKNKQTETNNTLEGINSRITEAKKWISDLEQNGGSICCKTEYRKKKVKRNEDGLRDLWDDIKCTFTI